MKIIVTDYPETFSFEIEETLPEFEFDCPIRSGIIQQYIKEHKLNPSYHQPEHYMVEEIIPFKGGEIWELGT